MAIVASATLWITGEFALWVIPVQIACYAISFATRHSPPDWRKSPVWLNVGMFAITGVTIAKALQGSPATLSLAYFAALSQGLQLIDARPRKSEFLLVALSLFQVVLASNLTDSVFFPPLVLIFLVSVTWTLLVHTLRTEAAAAQEWRSTRVALTPELKRTTALLSIGSIVLALGFFMVLPRMKTSMIRGALGPGMSVSGFSDEVSLGTIGRIRRDRRVVLRVETLEGPVPEDGAGYWRGLAFDRFDGRSWSITPTSTRWARTPVTGIPRFGVSFGTGPAGDALVQRIVREPVEAGVIFGAGPVQRIEGPIQHLQRDPNGGLYHPSGADDRVRYTLWTAPARRDERLLATDRTALPHEPGPRGERRAARYLDLPALDPAIGARAAEITAGARTDAERLARLEAHLREHGRYTDEPPDFDADAQGRSPVEAFVLGGLAGHCEYFASAMVVMSRSLGMPARLVNGFAGGRTNRIGGFTEVTRADAHAWVEVHFADAGWVRYDPTPPDLRWQAAGDPSLVERLAELGSVIELWWFQRVVDFDSADQIGALRSLWRVLRDVRAALPQLGGSTSPRELPRAEDLAPPRITVDWPVPVAALAALAAAAVLVRRRTRRSAGPDVAVQYRRALRLLARHRLPRDATVTAREHARRVRATAGPRVAAPFDALTEAYLARRFGGRRDTDTKRLDADLASLRVALRARRPARRAQRAP
jgi:transglutaminase-like putative cysteine protease